MKLFIWSVTIIAFACKAQDTAKSPTATTSTTLPKNSGLAQVNSTGTSDGAPSSTSSITQSGQNSGISVIWRSSNLTPNARYAEIEGNQSFRLMVEAKSSSGSQVLLGLVSSPAGMISTSQSSTMMELSWTSPRKFTRESISVFARDVAACERFVGTDQKTKCSDTKDSSVRNSNYDYTESFDIIRKTGGDASGQNAAVVGGIVAGAIGGILQGIPADDQDQVDDYEEDFEEDFEE